MAITVSANAGWSSQTSFATNVKSLISQGGDLSYDSGSYHLMFGIADVLDKIDSGWWIDTNNTNSLKAYIGNANSASKTFTVKNAWVTYNK